MTPEQALELIKSKKSFADFIGWMASWYQDAENYHEVFADAVVFYAENFQEI